MPRYNYHCKKCDEYFEVVHSMTEVLELCISCSSQDFCRIPSMPNYITKINKKSDKKTGSLVEEFIEKNRKSVKEEKENLRKQEYKK
jgi:putative FmdB family regulatory protein